MSVTLTAQDIISDGITLGLAGRTQAEAANARAEFVDLAAGIQARIETGAGTDLTSLCLMLHFYDCAIEMIDSLPLS